MLNALDNLPEDPVELRRVTELLASEVKAQALMIEKLQHQLHGANRHRFGSKSEGMDQLQLFAENEEIAEAAVKAAETAPAEPIELKEKPGRKPLPDHLERIEQVLSVGEDCPECGGDLSKLGEDITEELEYIPGRFVVNKITRPRMACRRCEAISQAPMPSRPIERGRPGPGLLAHVLVSKLDELLSGVERPEDLLGDKGLMKELKVRLMERMLGLRFRGCPRFVPHPADPANPAKSHKPPNTHKPASPAEAPRVAKPAPRSGRRKASLRDQNPGSEKKRGSGPAKKPASNHPAFRMGLPRYRPQAAQPLPAAFRAFLTSARTCQTQSRAARKALVCRCRRCLRRAPAPCRGRASQTAVAQHFFTYGLEIRARILAA